MTLLAVHVLGVGAAPATTPAIHADDEGFLRGRAVFETLRVYGGRPFRLADHLQRLGRSAAAIGLPEPDADRARSARRGGGRGRRRARRRAPLPLDAGPAGRRPAHRARARLDAAVRPRRAARPRDPARGRRLGARSPSRLGEVDELCGEPRRPRRGGPARLRRRPARRRRRRRPRGADRERLVARGRPAADSALAQPILAGVTRAALWELARAAGYEPEEGVFPLARPAGADEVFLTSVGARGDARRLPRRCARGRR